MAPWRGRHGATTRAGRNRSRYSRGLAPTRRANARRSVSTVPKPAARAMSSTGRLVVSSRRCATSTRADSTYTAGVHTDLVAEHAREVSRAHRDPAGQSLDAAGPHPDARRSTSATRGSGRAPRLCNPSCALNCACPPGRCTNITSWRAARSATSRPRSSSTSASARSMPAVTPAEVHTLPSRTKIGSCSTVTAGMPAREQFARPPVRRGAPPVEHARGGEQERARAHRRDPPAARGRARDRPHRARCRAAARPRSFPPTTMRVSIGPRNDRTDRSATIVGPRRRDDRPGRRRDR